MKHNLKVVFVLLFLFFISQVIGLAITSKYIKTEKTETGIQVTEVKPLPLNIERPPMIGGMAVFYILLGILIATALVLLLMKFKKTSWWRFWFLLAVFCCLTISFNAFIPAIFAVILAAALAFWKIFRPGAIIQNFTEVFVYSGLAAIFVPVLTLFSSFILLLLISVYDMIAVWQTKHMVKMAKFQAKSKIFAGLLIPYKLAKGVKKGKKAIKKKVSQKTAMLGGGDIGIPLIFAGVVMKYFGFYNALIVSLFATIALLLLFIKAKKGKYYPAMPFISLGCVLGYLVVLLI